jgi:site-specific recombinase XerD
LTFFTKFFSSYSGLAARTRSRYYFVFSAFFKWYNGEEIPLKIRVPKSVPQKVSDELFEKLLQAIGDRKTHKKKADRDILLVETAYHTGLRREELPKDHLKVGDLQLDGETPCLRVRSYKGQNDRVVPLNPYIRGKLAFFVAGKKPDNSLKSAVDLLAKKQNGESGKPISENTSKHSIKVLSQDMVSTPRS